MSLLLDSWWMKYTLLVSIGGILCNDLVWILYHAWSVTKTD